MIVSDYFKAQFGNLRRLSAVRRTGRSVCFWTRVTEGRKRTWAPESPDTSGICRLRSHVGMYCGGAKDGPRLSHSQRVNQSNSWSLLGRDNVEIDPLPVLAK